MLSIVDTEVSRRSMLRNGAAAVGTATSIGLSGCLYTMGLRQKEGRRRELARRQQRMAGPPMSFASQRKRISKQAATAVVRTRAELVSAVQKPNAVVWIPGDTTINMTRAGGQHPVAPGVTIASNRNLNGGTGGLIKTSDYVRRLFVVPEGSCRVTGIRLIGPTKRYLDPPYADMYNYAASGIHFKGESAIIDNCELAGWTSFAVGLGTRSTPTQAWMHHNHAHHCQMSGLGYFVESYNGLALIEWNDFSYYRHAISGYGYPSNGYEARFNRCGPAPNDPYAWAFDMHSLGEQDDHPDSDRTGGKYVNVHHNVFEIPESLSMSLSGVPTMYARHCRNWCSRRAIDGEDGADFRIKNNHFGTQAATQGRQWLAQMTSKLPLSDGTPSPLPWTRPTQNRPQRSHGRAGNAMGGH